MTLHDVIERIIHHLQFHTEADKQMLLDAVDVDRHKYDPKSKAAAGPEKEAK